MRKCPRCGARLYRRFTAWGGRVDLDLDAEGEFMVVGHTAYVIGDVDALPAYVARFTPHRPDCSIPRSRPG